MMNYLEALLTTAKVIEKLSVHDREERIEYAEQTQSQSNRDEEYEQDLADLLRSM